MANEKITSASGLKKAVFFALDTAGIPDGDQSGATPYNGEAITGIKSIALSVPDNQRIQHTGDDETFAQDALPPTELPSGTMTTGKTNQTLDALMSDTLVQTIGEWEMDGLATSKAGQEIDGMIAYYRQALVTDPDDSDFGSRRWQTHFIPKLKATAQGSTPDQGAADVNNYALTPTKTKQTPWGVAYTENDNGFLRAVRLRLTAENPVMLYRWTGNGTLTTFSTTFAPVTTAKTKVYNAATGAALTVSSVDTSAKTITLNSAPANGVKIIGLVETTDNIVP